MKKNYRTAFFLLPVLLAFGAYAAVSTSSEPAAAKTAPKSQGLWIDVRTPEEFKEGHLSGALNIPVDQIDRQIGRINPDKNSPIHLYCRSGRRADTALQKLKQMGYTNVTNHGSYKDLLAQGVSGSLPENPPVPYPNKHKHSYPTDTATAMKTHTLTSRYSFDETISRLQNAVTAKGMTVFTVIDHRAAAAQHGLAMQPAKVIIFGNPKAGTPLMQKDPAFSLQLPLRVLVTETGGSVQVSYNDTRALIQGSKIEYADVENSLANTEKLITQTVTK